MTLVEHGVLPEAAYAPLIYLSLFVTTFLHEGAAIAAAAVLLVQEQASPLLACAVLVAGIIAGDVAIYGLGALARRSAWLRRRLRVERAAPPWFDRNLLPIVAVCRVVPGVLFPTFLSYGWCGVPLRRFAFATTAVTALYVPVALFALVQFGLGLRALVQHWPWLALIVVVTASTAFAARRVWSRWSESLQALPAA
jgi:membrane protein DedA with SNARE-associated domain